MIDFVTINGLAHPLVTDDDYAEAKAEMANAGIDELAIYRAYTDDLDDFVEPGYDETACLPCDVVKTSNVLCATSSFYEVTLFDVEGEFYVAKPDNLDRAYPTEEVAIKSIADGYKGYALIDEDDLPAPLNNDHYTDLNLYRLEGTAGPSYVGIVRYIS